MLTCNTHSHMGWHRRVHRSTIHKVSLRCLRTVDLITGVAVAGGILLRPGRWGHPLKLITGWWVQFWISLPIQISCRTPENLNYPQARAILRDLRPCQSCWSHTVWENMSIRWRWVNLCACLTMLCQSFVCAPHPYLPRRAQQYHILSSRASQHATHSSSARGDRHRRILFDRGRF